MTLDVEEPGNPRLLTRYPVPVPVSPTALATWQGYAYVLDARGVHVIDLTHATGPVEVHLITGTFHAIAIVDGHLYAAIGRSLRILELVDPTHPAEVASLDLLPEGTYTRSMAVQGATVYVVSEGAGLSIVDVSDPASPALVAHVGGRLLNLATAESLLYIVDFDGFLRVLDVANPAQPQTIAVLELPVRAVAILVEGSKVYLGTQDTVRVVDVSNPIEPKEMTAWTTGGGWVRDLAISGTTLFVAAGDLRVVDLADPAFPSEIASVRLQEPIDRVVADGDQIFLVNGGGLWIVRNATG